MPCRSETLIVILYTGIVWSGFSVKCRALSQDRGAGGAGQPEVSAVRRAAAPQRRGVPGGRGQGPPPALPVPHGQEGPRRRPRHQVHTIRS
jgi:hypothetical protein